MASPRVLVLRAPGTNCDMETAYAFEQAGAVVSRIHVNRLIEDPRLGSDHQVLCLPGGFSYGDDIAAGRILASRLSVHLRDLVEEFRQADRLVLGICNGFQVMMRLGIFFDDRDSPPVTLAHNSQDRFEDRWVQLVNWNSNSIFLAGIERMFLPIAHAEGRIVFRDTSNVERLERSGQLGLRYAAPVTADTAPAGIAADALASLQPLAFPHNPNGSQFDLAGLSDSTGRVFGLMPHPERFIDPTQHPFWTRLPELPECGEGQQIFANAVRYFA